MVNSSGIIIGGRQHIDADAMAEKLQMSDWHVRRLAREGKLPGRKVGQKWWFDVGKALDKISSNITTTDTPDESEDWENDDTDDDLYDI